MNKINRSISPFALMLTSVSAIIGSGWLFSSYFAATLAGPAALISWIIGGVGIIIVAFVFGEVCSLLPVSGSSARIPRLTHGSIVNFMFAWIVWLSYASFAPTETQAVIQYVSFYFPNLLNVNSSLTKDGYITASIIMLVISFINVYSLRWLIRFNNFLTVLKIIIPLIISCLILSVFFSIPHTLHPAGSKFMPFGMHGIFGAIVTGGIIFAFNGFKQAGEMAGEAKNPKTALPIAIIGSVVICLILFILLQVAFFDSLQPSNLAHGWSKLTLPIDKNSPLSSILYQDKLTRYIPLLYLCAIVAPLAAALMYCSSAARSLYGMSKSGSFPSIFQKVTLQGNPGYAIAANFVIGMLMFAPLPGWKSMVSFISSLVAVTYSIGPITLLALRQQLPDHPRTFRLPFATIWATTAFYICTLLIYWCGWNIIWKLDVSLIIALVIMIIHHNNIKPDNAEHPFSGEWLSSIWFWAYFCGISIISYLGSFEGINVITFGLDFLVIAIFSIFIVWLALKYKLHPENTAKYLEELKSETGSLNNKA